MASLDSLTVRFYFLLRLLTLKNDHWKIVKTA